MVVDSHTKWVEAYPTDSATSSKVIELSRTLFAQFGIPEVVVTDNGPCFVSQEFETYLTKNGVKHITSAPYHPSSNGLAERAVQLVKKGLKKEKEGTMSSRIARVLMAYRTTPQSTTGMTPSDLLQGRRIRTRLDLLKPNVNERVEHRQFQQKLAHDSSAKQRAFQKGDSVYAQNFGTGSKWVSAVIQEVAGPVSFLVKLQDGRIMRRHQDHLRRRLATPEQEVPADDMQNRPSQEETTVDIEIEIPGAPTVPPPASDPTDTESTDMPSSVTSHNTSPSVENSRSSTVNESIETSGTTASEVNVSPSTSNTQSTAGIAKQYPGRKRKPPNRYM